MAPGPFIGSPRLDLASSRRFRPGDASDDKRALAGVKSGNRVIHAYLHPNLDASLLYDVYSDSVTRIREDG
jgi:hypothetical protein